MKSGEEKERERERQMIMIIRGETQSIDGGEKKEMQKRREKKGYLVSAAKNVCSVEIKKGIRES